MSEYAGVVLDVGSRTSLSYARNAVVVEFMSTTAGVPLAQQTFADVTNTMSGYYSMLQTYAATYTFGGWQTALSDGTFNLRCISDMQTLRGAKSIRLTRIQFRCYDFTEANESDPLAPPFSGVETGGWQPNFFRPRVKINEKVVMFGGGAGFGFFDAKQQERNYADQTIGFDLPYCEEPNYQAIDLGMNGISSIDIWAACGRILSTGGEGEIQNYPVKCSLAFVIQEI